MSPADKLASLGEGEILEGDLLFGGLTDARVEVVARTVSKAGAVTLDLSFMGVKLATAAGKPDNGKITWWEAK